MVLSRGAVFPMERPVVHFSTVIPIMPSVKTAPAKMDFPLWARSSQWRSCGTAK